MLYANQPMAKPMRKATLASKMLNTVRTNHTTTKCQKRIGMRVANMHGMLPEKNNTLLMLVILGRETCQWLVSRRAIVIDWGTTNATTGASFCGAGSFCLVC